MRQWRIVLRNKNRSKITYARIRRSECFCINTFLKKRRILIKKAQGGQSVQYLGLWEGKGKGLFLFININAAIFKHGDDSVQGFFLEFDGFVSLG